MIAAMVSPAYAADAPAFPSDTALKLKSQHIARPRMPGAVARDKASRYTHGKLSRIHADTSHAPKVPGFPARPSAHVDFNEVINNANKAQTSIKYPANTSPDLLVFVSFSMPKESLTRLAAQAGRAGAAIMLRGLVADTHAMPSFHATSIAVGKLNLKNGQGFSVNPMPFRRFGVMQVPAFVLLTQKDCATCGEGFVPKHLKLTGDVSLDYALRAMKSRKPGISARVNPYLARMKTGFFQTPVVGGARN